jgi:hypothetical protein
MARSAGRSRARPGERSPTSACLSTIGLRLVLPRIRGSSSTGSATRRGAKALSAGNRRPSCGRAGHNEAVRPAGRESGCEGLKVRPSRIVLLAHAVGSEVIMGSPDGDDLGPTLTPAGEVLGQGDLSVAPVAPGQTPTIPGWCARSTRSIVLTATLGRFHRRAQTLPDERVGVSDRRSFNWSGGYRRLGSAESFSGWPPGQNRGAYGRRASAPNQELQQTAANSRGIRTVLARPQGVTRSLHRKPIQRL